VFDAFAVERRLRLDDMEYVDELDGLDLRFPGAAEM
jgi:hypothetical protein